MFNEQGGAGEDAVPDRVNFEAVSEVIPQALGSKNIVIPQLEVGNFPDLTLEMEATEDPSTNNKSEERKSYPERIRCPPKHYQAKEEGV